jgi:hypothetical protein
MPTKKVKLSVAQQRQLMKRISANQLNQMKKHCLQCKMGGSGVGDMWRSVKNAFKSAIPFIGDIGGKVLKDVLLPKLTQKVLPMAGNILSKVLGNGYAGKGLKLSGSGAKQVVPRRKMAKLHLG